MCTHIVNHILYWAFSRYRGSEVAIGMFLRQEMIFILRIGDFPFFINLERKIGRCI